MNGDPVRRPGGLARLLLLAATAVGFFAVFSVGFPPAARGRLPILLAALALALVSAYSPARGLLAFSFFFPLAGIGDRAFGGADAIAWPVLLFAGFAAGWTFRFLYDFESAADSSRADPWLRALAAVWGLAALSAAVQARTLWALLHGLGLRAVNVEGLPDSAAIRDAVLALATLASGAGFFFLLRRAGEALRRRSLVCALAGCAVSAAAAVGQRAGLAPGETSGFWKMTGRLSGGAIDPNALGMLCGLALVVAVALLLWPPRGRAGPLALAAASAAGLALSGSRSSIVVVAVGIVALGLAPGLPGKLRFALGGGCAAAVLAAGVLLSQAAAGNVASRLQQSLNPGLPVHFRVSARPLLWQSAVRLFERHPVEGAGLGAFSWQLPTLLAERGLSLPIRDNPGNAYLQALAETGAVGFLLTLALAAIFAREGWAAVANWKQAPWAAGAGAAVLGFLVALGLGSHWFAPDVALFFFLLASIATRAAAPSPAPGIKMARARRLLIAVYAVAAAVAVVGTLSPGEAFRYRQSIGFHAKEIGPGGPFYWTQRRFAIRLSPGETMSLGLAHFTPEGKGVALTAESDGRILYRRQLEAGQAVSLRLSSSGAEPGLIRFALSRTFVPKRLGLSSDRRELGLLAVFPPRS